MDFHGLSRKELQALCKINKVPANMTNIAMADALKALECVEGIENLLKTSETESPKKSEKTTMIAPRTGGRTAPRRKIVTKEPETVQTLTRSRSTRKKVDVIDVEALKIDVSCNESEEIVKEKKDVTVVKASRRKGVKETNSVKPVYSTRRSTRLSKRNESEKKSSEVVKIDSFTEEIDENMEIYVDEKESSEEIEADSFTEEMDEKMEINVKESISEEKENFQGVKIDSFTEEMDENMEIGLKESNCELSEVTDNHEAVSDAEDVIEEERANDTEPSDDNNKAMEKDLDMDNEVQENNGSEEVYASEIANNDASEEPMVDEKLENEAVEALYASETFKDDDEASESVVDECTENEVMEVFDASETAKDEAIESVVNEDLDDNVAQVFYSSETAKEEVSESLLSENLETETAMVEENLENEVAKDFYASETTKGRESESLVDKIIENEVTQVFDASAETAENEALEFVQNQGCTDIAVEGQVQQSENGILGFVENIEKILGSVENIKKILRTNKQIKTDADETINSQDLHLKEFSPVNSDLATVRLACVSPVKKSPLSTITPMKRSEDNRTQKIAKRVINISDDKENVVVIKEDKPLQKKDLNHKQLEDLSMRQLTKMFKEKLQITKSNKAVITRPALRTLSENCRVGESQN